MEESKGLVTRELLDTWRRTNDSIQVIIKDGSALIRLSAKVRAPKGFSSSETVYKDFNGFSGSIPRNFSEANFWHSVYEFTKDNWTAFFQLVKVGDKLVFSVDDNVNTYLRIAQIPSSAWKDEEFRGYHPDYYGLHNDELSVAVYRNGKAVLTRFVLMSSQCPDNSARPLK